MNYKNWSVKVLVVGGGVAGLSAAYHLAKKGVKDVVVIEQEKRLGGHSSGRNAGMIRQAVSDPILAALAVQGRNSLYSAEKQGWSLGFKRCGSLLLASDAKGAGELEKTRQATGPLGLVTEWLKPAGAAKRVSLLREGDYQKALWCPSDASIKIENLIRAFVKALRRLGVPVLCGYSLESIEKKDGVFKVRANGRTFLAEKVVNAAGAWAGNLGKMAGATPIPFKPYRRHLFESRPFRPFDAKWPFVWDLSNEFYFRPLENGLLLSPCDKMLCAVISKGEKIDSQMQKALFQKLNRFSPNFAKLKIKKAKSGLRTMTPDGRFVLGEDPRVRGFFWTAGLGGHGVTTCFAVGNFVSDLILGKKGNEKMTRALSPKRFLNAA